MTFILWLFYGLLTSTIIYFLFPTNIYEGVRFILVLGVFIVLGGMDYLVSHSMDGKRNSFRY